MLSTSPITASRNRVLGSVFSPASRQNLSSPTSLALGITTLNHPSKSADPLISTSRSVNRPSDATEYIDESLPDQDWDRAWHIATEFLSVPDRGFAPLAECKDTGEAEFLKGWNRYGSPSKETSDALAYLVAPLGRDGLCADKGQHSIFGWYESEMRRHFLKNFRDGLVKVRDLLG